MYRHALNGVLVRCCLTKQESRKVMWEAHEGSCGRHQGGEGFNFYCESAFIGQPSCIKIRVFLQSHAQSQLHAPVHHLPAEPFHSVGAYWLQKSGGSISSVSSHFPQKCTRSLTNSSGLRLYQCDTKRVNTFHNLLMKLLFI